MTPNTTKLVAITFFGLSAAMAVNLLMLQPTASSRLAGRSQQHPTQTQALALTAEVPRAGEASTDAKTKGKADPRLAAQEKDKAKPQPTPQRAATAEPLPNGDNLETIRAIQRELQARGYEAGTVDGVPGLITRAAILAYEYDHGLAMTGEASERLLKQILLGELQPAAAPGAIQSHERSPQAEQVIRTVQQSLANAGYAVGKPDGRMGEETVRAIREFETDQGLPETGRVSGQLVARLARLAGQGRLTTVR